MMRCLLRGTIQSPRGVPPRLGPRNVLLGGAIVGWALWTNVVGLVLASEAPTASSTDAAAPVVLKLHWYPQAQFAGYLMAQEKRFFQAAGAGDVEICWSTAGERTLDTLTDPRCWNVCIRSLSRRSVRASCNKSMHIASTKDRTT
jgi:hypothetical protein